MFSDRVQTGDLPRGCPPLTLWWLGLASDPRRGEVEEVKYQDEWQHLFGIKALP